MLALGCAGGLGLGMWQMRSTAEQLELRSRQHYDRLSSSLEQVEHALEQLQQRLDVEVVAAGSERNDIRAQVQDLTLAVADLRMVAQPLVAEIPELPIAPQ